MDHKYHIINYVSINSLPCKNYSIIYVRNFNHFAEKIEEGAKFMPYKGRMSRMCRQLYKIENFMCESGGRTPKLTKDSPTNTSCLSLCYWLPKCLQKLFCGPESKSLSTQAKNNRVNLLVLLLRVSMKTLTTCWPIKSSTEPHTERNR